MQKNVFFCIYLTREIVYKVLEHLLVRQMLFSFYLSSLYQIKNLLKIIIRYSPTWKFGINVIQKHFII